MAAIIKQIFLPLGILTLGWVGLEVQSFLYQPTFAQAQNVAVIPVSLPEKVTVHPKHGSTISGVRLLEINAQTQQIKLQQGSNTESKSIASIESLTFSGRAIIRGGKIVIRGGVNAGSKCGNTENWTLPLNHVQVRDSSQAEVNLTSIPPGRQREIRQINGAKTYILDEIKFGTPGRLTLKTTPCFAN
jgi:hypothetical protein